MKIILMLLMFVGVVFGDRDGGPYIGVGYGVSKYNDDGLYGSINSDSSASATIYGGAYINKHLSVELGYASFDAWDKKEGYEIDELTKVSYSAATVSVLAHYAFFDDILDFYAKGGVGQIDASGISASGFTIVYGGGIGVRFSDLLGMKVAYDRYTFEYKDPASGNYDMYIDFMYGALEVQF
jgi:hypothetical protein